MDVDSQLLFGQGVEVQNSSHDRDASPQAESEKGRWDTPTVWLNYGATQLAGTALPVHAFGCRGLCGAPTAANASKNWPKLWQELYFFRGVVPTITDEVAASPMRYHALSSRLYMAIVIACSSVLGWRWRLLRSQPRIRRWIAGC